MSNKVWIFEKRVTEKNEIIIYFIQRVFGKNRSSTQKRFYFFQYKLNVFEIEISCKRDIRVFTYVGDNCESECMGDDV